MKGNGTSNIKASIVGGAGYTGGELIRLLLNHPHVTLASVHSRSQAGQPLSSVHQDLLGETDLRFSQELEKEVDVIFLCAGHGEARVFLEKNELPAQVRIIDLSHDFRLAAKSSIGSRQFVYGLPELNRDQIRNATNIANPGCFATALQLGLLPLAKAGLLDEVHATGITGSTGAGQGLSPTSHFSWRANNVQAYKTLTHQHLGEVRQSLQQLSGKDSRVHFVPWRGDFTRGIFISSIVHTNLGAEQAGQLYAEFYRDHAFTLLSEQPIALKQVVNTNKCVLQLEVSEDQLVIHAAIDNLLKGASGQAVQNMNLMFGFDEREGLRLKPSSF